MKQTISRERLEKTAKLADAVRLVFGVLPEGRTCVLETEAMKGSVAEAYDELGKKSRSSTYKKIVRDFLQRVKWKGNGGKTIIDVGCGSGLLAIELAKQTDAVVVGFDVSEDMINLAKRNLEQNTLSIKNPERIEFFRGSVYALRKFFCRKPFADYVICRNALHRFERPSLALRQMYSSLKEGGSIYLRDLRRDADWNVIVERIGNQRWERPELVKDYVGAMAGMMTVDELKKVLERIRITDYSIPDNGEYLVKDSGVSKDLDERTKEVDYVCIIGKS